MIKYRLGEDDTRSNFVVENESSYRFKILTFVCVLYVLLAFFLRLFVYDINTVSGDSMLPVLQNGDVLLSTICDLDSIERYDIVTIKSNNVNLDDKMLVKRIVGLPGEVVTIFADGRVAINNQDLPDCYQICDETDDNLKYLVNYEIKLADDEYYVLGDNRGVSADSRIYGPFKISDIRGKVQLRILPFCNFCKMSKLMISS